MFKLASCLLVVTRFSKNVLSLLDFVRMVKFIEEIFLNNVYILSFKYFYPAL